MALANGILRMYCIEKQMSYKNAAYWNAKLCKLYGIKWSILIQFQIILLPSWLCFWCHIFTVPMSIRYSIRAQAQWIFVGFYALCTNNWHAFDDHFQLKNHVKSGNVCKESQWHKNHWVFFFSIIWPPYNKIFEVTALFYCRVQIWEAQEKEIRKERNWHKQAHNFVAIWKKIPLHEMNPLKRTNHTRK